MKSKKLLALAGLLIVSMLAISPIYAQGIIYRANGRFDEYLDPEYDDARIYLGIWRLRIKNDKVEFKAFYLEENINEEIPGTLDFFRLVLTDVIEVNIVDSVCTIEGALVWHKIGWDNPEAPGGPGYEDLPGPFYKWVFSIDVSITIDPDGILIVFHPPGVAGGIVGSTLSIHY